MKYLLLIMTFFVCFNVNAEFKVGNTFTSKKITVYCPDCSIEELSYITDSLPNNKKDFTPKMKKETKVNFGTVIFRLFVIMLVLFIYAFIARIVYILCGNYTN